MGRKDWHPGFDDLLKASFRELPDAQNASIEAHLAQCPSCRLHYDEIRSTIAGFSDSYESVYKGSVPPPPNGWTGFSAALRERKSRPLSIRERLQPWLRVPQIRLIPALSAAALLLLVVFGVQRMREAPGVSAKEILERAATVQKNSFQKVNQAAVYQKLRVRVGSRTLTRSVYRDITRQRQVDRWTDRENTAVPGVVRPALAGEMAEDFRAVRLDWNDPLNPAGIRSWLEVRAGGARATESVEEAGGSFTLTSVSAVVPLREARFTVRAADYHPVAAHFRFEDRKDVEVTELAYEVRGLESFDRAIVAELSGTAGVAPKTEAAVAAEPPRVAEAGLDAVEVQARYALHRHRADIGEETQVERTPSGITVKGMVVSNARREELRAALRDLHPVRVELQTAQEAAARQVHGLAATAETPGRAPRHAPALEQALASGFPDQQARDAFVLATLEASQEALARGFALNRLAARYSPSAMSALGAASRRDLLVILTGHEQALSGSATALFDRLAPLAGSIPAPPDAPDSRRAWQDTQASLLRDLQRLDTLVGALLSGTGDEPADPAILLPEYLRCASQVRAGLQQLAADLR